MNVDSRKCATKTVMLEICLDQQWNFKSRKSRVTPKFRSSTPRTQRGELFINSSSQQNHSAPRSDPLRGIDHSENSFS